MNVPEFVAEISGFAAGFGLSFLLIDGGFRQVMARLRSRP